MPLTVELDDGTRQRVLGRRAALILHLLLRATYLDDPAFSVGKLELSWKDGDKVEARATRFTRESWMDGLLP